MATTYEILCKNHAGDEVKWQSLNPDNSVFYSHNTEPGHDKHIHLPSQSCTVNVEIEDDGWTGLWSGTVNAGDHLVADGVWPEVKLSLNGKSVN